LAFFAATAAVLHPTGRHLALPIIVLANSGQVLIRRPLSGSQNLLPDFGEQTATRRPIDGCRGRRGRRGRTRRNAAPGELV